ncbi:MAG: hypothetical protein HFG37_09700 [Eubacterium sp.]|nr:hypothetical protein [Eubacterium sp.]
MEKKFKIKQDYTDYEYKSLRLPKILIDKTQILANKNGLSFNKVVIQCIEFALENLDETKKSSK